MTLDLTLRADSICYVHDSLHHRNSTPFSEHFQLSQVSTRSHPLSIQLDTSSINSFHYSVFVNSPFWWNTIPHAILQIKKSNLFRAALHHFLFWYVSCGKIDNKINKPLSIKQTKPESSQISKSQLVPEKFACMPQTLFYAHPEKILERLLAPK